MAYTVNFGTMNKKVNSTKNDFTVSVVASCALKAPCDVYSPVFTFQGDFPVRANYMYVPDFGRYYWIVRTEFNYGHWEITGKSDALASFKTDIGSQEQYISRSSVIRDGLIIDNAIPTHTAPNITSHTVSMGFDADGCYIVCIVGSAGNNFYLLSRTAWQQLYSKIFSDQFLTDYKNAWTALVDNFTNQMFRPEDYIISAKWIPFAYPGGPGENIVLGYTNTNVAGIPVSAGGMIYNATFDLISPAHPQTDTVGAFCNSNMFRKINLFIPGYGSMPIDADLSAGELLVKLNVAVDVTGVMYIRVSVGNWTTCVSTNVGTDAGFSVTRTDVSGFVASMANTAVSATNLNVGGVASGAVSAVTAAFPSVERIAQGGSRALQAASPNIILTTLFYNLVDEIGDRLGHSYCRYVTPASLGGYMVVSNASVACAGTETEINEINSFMEGGFYYE